MSNRRELSLHSAAALFSRTAHPHPRNMVQGAQATMRGGIRF